MVHTLDVVVQARVVNIHAKSIAHFHEMVLESDSPRALSRHGRRRTQVRVQGESTKDKRGDETLR